MDRKEACLEFDDPENKKKVADKRGMRDGVGKKIIGMTIKQRGRGKKDK